MASAPRAIIRIPKVTAIATNGPASTPLANPVQATRRPIIVIIIDIAPTALLSPAASI